MSELNLKSSDQRFHDEFKSTVDAERHLRRSVILLTILYCVQGVPLGLALGSLPYMLANRASYAALGVFSLAAYPYSLKLLWSPIVDAVFSASFGRRKSWIVPIQFLSGSLLLWMSYWLEPAIASDAALDINMITFWSCVLVFCSATQDIAVDGWAITMLPKQHLALASTVQSVGLQIGFFSSFTVLLALNSADFSNAHVRPLLGWAQNPSSGVLSLSSYLFFWALLYLAVSVYLIFHQEELFQGSAEELDIRGTYAKMARSLANPSVRRLSLLLLTAKIGLIAFDVVTGLKMLDKGFRKQDLALFAVLDFPVQLASSVLIGRAVTGASALQPYFAGYTLRLLVGILLTLLLLSLPTRPADPISWSVFAAGALGGMAYSFSSTVQFVAMGAFFARICDTSISGTFMTLLNTLNNFAGTAPKIFILALIEWLSDVPCVSSSSSTFPEQCSSPEARELCTAAGGFCEERRDGFAIVALLSALYALLYAWFVLRNQLPILEKLPESSYHSGAYSKKFNKSVPL